MGAAVEAEEVPGGERDALELVEQRRLAPGKDTGGGFEAVAALVPFAGVIEDLRAAIGVAGEQDFGRRQGADAAADLEHGDVELAAFDVGFGEPRAAEGLLLVRHQRPRRIGAVDDAEIVEAERGVLERRLDDEAAVGGRIVNELGGGEARRAQHALHSELFAGGLEAITAGAGVAIAQPVEQFGHPVQLVGAFGDFLDEVEDDVGREGAERVFGALAMVGVFGLDQAVPEAGEAGADLARLNEGVVLVGAGVCGARRHQHGNGQSFSARRTRGGCRSRR